MAYTTVYESREKTKLFLVRSIFDQNDLDYRVLDEHSNNNFAIGARIQVKDNQEERAYALLKENGLIGLRIPSESDNESDSGRNFWTFFILAILAVVIVSLLINWFMAG